MCSLDQHNDCVFFLKMSIFKNFFVLYLTRFSWLSIAAGRMNNIVRNSGEIKCCLHFRDVAWEYYKATLICIAKCYASVSCQGNGEMSKYYFLHFYRIWKKYFKYYVYFLHLKCRTRINVYKYSKKRLHFPNVLC